jgi:hypothetical protein
LSRFRGLKVVTKVGRRKKAFLKEKQREMLEKKRRESV